FKNCVIIMTSNLGASLITGKGGSLGFSGDENGGVMSQQKIHDAVMGELKRTLRPEFLNRVDDIIVFRQLTKEDIKEIAKRLLGNLSKRTKQLEIELQFSDEAVEKIADAGFDPVYGARPLKRAIQSMIEDKLSELMLDGTVKENNSYLCTVQDGEFTFIKQ
ncbi:MAG: ATP-dependent Clp protease ATP-binding subunit, partial [Clostridia bacterium]|nr:ATP-dependent Clp protease ATP-binding subunit [Clostridia bacterium]